MAAPTSLERARAPSVLEAFARCLSLQQESPLLGEAGAPLPGIRLSCLRALDGAQTAAELHAALAGQLTTSYAHAMSRALDSFPLVGGPDDVDSATVGVCHPLHMRWADIMDAVSTVVDENAFVFIDILCVPPGKSGALSSWLGAMRCGLSNAEALILVDGDGSLDALQSARCVLLLDAWASLRGNDLLLCAPPARRRALYASLANSASVLGDLDTALSAANIAATLDEAFGAARPEQGADGPRPTATVDVERRVQRLVRSALFAMGSEALRIQEQDGQAGYTPLRSALASLAEKLDMLSVAERLHRAQVHGSEALLGPRSAEHMAALNGLALYLRKHRRLADAEEVYRMALGRVRLGTVLPPRAAVAFNLALLLRGQGRQDEAIRVARAVRRGQRLSRGTGDLDRFAVSHLLSIALFEAGRLAAAERECRRLLRMRARAHGRADDHTRMTAQLLGSILDARGKADSAQAVRQKFGAVAAEVGQSPPHLESVAAG